MDDHPLGSQPPENPHDEPSLPCDDDPAFECPQPRCPQHPRESASQHEPTLRPDEAPVVENPQHWSQGSHHVDDHSLGSQFSLPPQAQPLRSQDLRRFQESQEAQPRPLGAHQEAHKCAALGDLARAADAVAARGGAHCATTGGLRLRTPAPSAGSRRRAGHATFLVAFCFRSISPLLCSFQFPSS